MRRLIILGLLYGLMQLVLPLGGAAEGAPALLLLGFLILAAYSVGELATAVRVPQIVGYMAAGLIFGPSYLSFLDTQVVSDLQPISDLAIALIAFLAGAELQLEDLKKRGVQIGKMMFSEFGISFLAIAACVAALSSQLTTLADAPWTEILAFSVLFASVAVVHSPAATIALLSETKAKGPVAKTTLSIVLLADVAVVLSFSAALALAKALVPPAGGGTIAIAAIIWEIGGAVLVGAALGVVVALYLRFIRRELFIFAILVALLGAEVARIAHVETLLMLLVAGFVAENASGERGENFRHAMERAAAPIFVVFFALAGAKLVPGALLPLWTVLVPVVLVRGVAIWGGMRIGARWAGADTSVTNNAWYGLISQAGVAFGLAAVVAEVYPERGQELQTLFLAVIAVNQTLGPIMFRLGLAKAGELGGGGGEDESGESDSPDAPDAPGDAGDAAPPESRESGTPAAGGAPAPGSSGPTPAPA
jgi:Kef-type K+ transport system membrane component KefB